MAGVRPIAVENLKQAGRVLRCIYIKTNGVQCGSPALRSCAYCYAHSRLAMRHPPLLDIPILEDANSVQVAIMEVIRGLLSGEVDRKTGGLILYGLQMAASNLKYVSFEPKDRASVIRNVDDVVRYCNVETDTGADQADTARAASSPCEEARAAINNLESDATAEMPVEALQPQTVVARDMEPAPASFVDQSSTQPVFDLNSPAVLQQIEKLREELRAKSGKGPLPSDAEVQEAGIKNTGEMLDALAEAHRLAKVVVDAQRRIGESFR
jgi:hypothetical protein